LFQQSYSLLDWLEPWMGFFCVTKSSAVNMKHPYRSTTNFLAFALGLLAIFALIAFFTF
jgi:hypothetical protein